MSDKIKLMPCLCGGECVQKAKQATAQYYNHCKNCGSGTPIYPTEAEAAEAWNKMQIALKSEQGADYDDFLQRLDGFLFDEDTDKRMPLDLLMVAKQFLEEAYTFNNSGDRQRTTATTMRNKFSICHEFVQRYTQHDSTNIDTAQELWQTLQCEKLPLPFAQVLYFLVHSGADKQDSIQLLHEICNAVAVAYIDDYKEIMEINFMTDVTIDVCQQLEANCLDFYTSRMFVRRSFQSLENKTEHARNVYQALMGHLEILERNY